MNTQDFIATFSVDQAPEAVFDAINNVRGWWSGEIEGDTDHLGAEFTYRYKDVHCSTQRITDFIRGKRIVWRVVDSSLTFVKDTSEWNETEIVFEICETHGKSELRFTHRGLIPQVECYRSCTNAWRMLINGNLPKLIATGERQRDVFA
jgi:hypothetical protein